MIQQAMEKKQAYHNTDSQEEGMKGISQFGLQVLTIVTHLVALPYPYYNANHLRHDEYSMKRITVSSQRCNTRVNPEGYRALPNVARDSSTRQ